MSTSIDEAALETSLDRLLHRRAAVGLVVGVIRDGRLRLLRAHGVADAASGRPVSADTVFRIASITKTVTAVAVMQLSEQGLIDLDSPADDYLRAFRLQPASPGHRPATVRDLLTHTAGLPELAHPWGALRPDFGESVPLGQPLPSLAEFYRGRLRLHAEPGARFVYGNHGFAALGQLVEDVTTTPLDRYLREHVFDPLGMASTDLVRSDRIVAGLATGYQLRGGGPHAVAAREMVTAGAASVYSSPRDMARYVAALLGGGANEHGSVLRPETVAAMFRPQYRPDPRVPGIGLAFERVDLGGHVGVGHQGSLPGFGSHLLLAPDDGTGVIAFTNGARLAELWLPDATAGLLRRLLGAPADAVRDDVPQRPETWDELCGWYDVPARATDVRLRGMLGAGAEVIVRRGQLWLRGLAPVPVVYRGFPLRPDDTEDAYAFRVDLSELGLGSLRVVFVPRPELGTTLIHLDAMPLTLRRQRPATNPRRWAATVALGGLAVAGGAAAVRVVASTAQRGRVSSSIQSR